MTSWSVAGSAVAGVGGIGSCFISVAPWRTVGVPTGRQRPGGDIRELLAQNRWNVCLRRVFPMPEKAMTFEDFRVTLAEMA